jgi:putative endonuclease
MAFCTQASPAISFSKFTSISTLLPGFTARYHCKQLVYYEAHENMLSAITREKQIKAGSRKKKIILIEIMNPQWQDLYFSLLG